MPWYSQKLTAQPESESRPIAEPIEKFLDVFNEPEAPPTKDVTKIKVHAVVSKMAFLYEKIRNIVEYKEEQLLRKNAIQRFLKRKILGPQVLIIKARPKKLGLALISDLIRSGYLENNSVPETKATEVDHVLKKYFALLDELPTLEHDRDTHKRTEWLLGLAAVEIEETLTPTPRNHALVEAMFTVVKDDVEIKSKKIDENEKDLQKYIAVRRALLRTDDLLIAYELWKLYNAGWLEGSEEAIKKAAIRFDATAAEIQRQITHPLSDRLTRFYKGYAILFHVIRQTIEDDEGEAYEVLASPERLKKVLRDVVNKNYKETRSRLTRSVIRTVIYLFLTKMFIALVLEIPLDVYLMENVNLQALGINILFPPMLMLIIALTIHVPLEKNTKRIIQGVEKIVYEGKSGIQQQKINPRGSRGVIKNFVFRVVYAIVFLLPFVLISWGLVKLQFNIVSIVIFIFFLTIISFFGIKLRQRAREIAIIDQKENLWSLMIDFFSIPILSVGRWFSVRFARINVFVFILDVLIEAPFKAFIEALEEWLAYLREKKEEI